MPICPYCADAHAHIADCPFRAMENLPARVHTPTPYEHLAVARRVCIADTEGPELRRMPAGVPAVWEGDQA